MRQQVTMSATAKSLHSNNDMMGLILDDIVNYKKYINQIIKEKSALERKILYIYIYMMSIYNVNILHIVIFYNYTQLGCISLNR